MKTRSLYCLFKHHGRLKSLSLDVANKTLLQITSNILRVYLDNKFMIDDWLNIYVHIYLFNENSWKATSFIYYMKWFVL